MKNTNQNLRKMKVQVSENKENVNGKKNKVVFSNLTKEQKETLLSVGIGSAIIAGATGVALYAVGSDGKDYEDEAALEAKAAEVKYGEDAVTIVEETVEAAEAAEAVEGYVDDYGNASEVVIIYTDAPWAYLPEDEMDFTEAFEIARADVGGGGGFFHWNGEIYNTYNAEEWEAMTDGEREQYYTSIENMTDVSRIPAPEYETVEYTVTKQEFIGEEDILSSIDYSNDGINDGYIVDVDGNEYYDVVLDLDGNGKIDELILDLENIHDGNVNAIQVNALPTDFEVMDGDIPIEKPIATVSITEDDVIESANITGDSNIDAVLVNVDGNDRADIGFDSDSNGDIDVVVVDLGTPTQEIIEIDAVSITPKMMDVKVTDDVELSDIELEEEYVEGFDLDAADMDADADLGDDIDYSEFS